MKIKGYAVWETATYVFGNVFLTAGVGIDFSAPLMSMYTFHSTILTSTGYHIKIKQNCSEVWNLNNCKIYTPIFKRSSSSPKCPDRLFGPPSLLFSGYQGYFPGIKQSEFEVNRSLPSCAKVTMSGTVTLHLVYRVSQKESARIRDCVPYVKVYRYNPKHHVKIGTVTEIMARGKWGLFAGPRTVPVGWQSYPIRHWV